MILITEVIKPKLIANADKSAQFAYIPGLKTRGFTHQLCNQNKQTLLETQLEKTFPSFKQKDFSQRLLSPNTETKLHPVQEN